MKTFTRTGATTALALAIGTLLVLPDDGSAQQKRSFTYKTPAETKYTQQHVIDAGDVPGHQVRVYEIHYTYNPADAPRYEGVRVVEEWTRGYSDYTNGTGSFRSYNTTILENGDKIFWQGSGTTQTTVQSDGTKQTTFHGAGSTTGATGKMRGIRGLFKNAGGAEFREGKASALTFETQVEYWFE